MKPENPQNTPKPGQDAERKHPVKGHGHEDDRERDREKKRNWDKKK